MIRSVSHSRTVSVAERSSVSLVFHDQSPIQGPFLSSVPARPCVSLSLLRSVFQSRTVSSLSPSTTSYVSLVFRDKSPNQGPYLSYVLAQPCVRLVFYDQPPNQVPSLPSAPVRPCVRLVFDDQPPNRGPSLSSVPGLVFHDHSPNHSRVRLCPTS